MSLKLLMIVRFSLGPGDSVRGDVGEGFRLIRDPPTAVTAVARDPTAVTHPPAEGGRLIHLIRVTQAPAEGELPLTLLLAILRIHIRVAEASRNPPGLDDAAWAMTASLFPIPTALCLAGMVTPVRATLQASMEEGCP